VTGNGTLRMPNPMSALTYLRHREERTCFPVCRQCGNKLDSGTLQVLAQRYARTGELWSVIGGP
jgi:hypothetical protein